MSGKRKYKPRNSRRREQILDFIIQYKLSHDGLSPSLREIGDGVELFSTGVIHQHIEKLIKQGYLAKYGQRYTSRSIMVVGAKWTPPPGYQRPPQRTSSKK